MTSVEDSQVIRLRLIFPNWVIFQDAYGITGRRRVNGFPESYTALSAIVLQSHLANAEFRDIITGVLARSA